MTEVDVTLTDYAVAAECVCFTYLLAPLRTPTSQLATVFMVFFSTVAFGATAGGTVHGFFSDERSMGHRILWPLTLVCMGITALAGLHIGATLLFSHAAVRLIAIGGALVFFVYAIVVLFLRRDFRLAVLNYVPPLIFMAGAFLMASLREGKTAVLVGF